MPEEATHKGREKAGIHKAGRSTVVAARRPATGEASVLAEEAPEEAPASEEAPEAG